MKNNKSALKAWVTKRTPMPERFWNRVEKKGEDDCWEYRGVKHHFGHGAFKINGKETGAHRMAWSLTNGPIPKGMLVLHHCDNPPCCNPKHLYAGTHADNAKDASQRKRYPDRRGEKAGNSKVTNEQAIEIRMKYALGNITHHKLGLEYGICKNAVGAIVNKVHFNFD